MRYIKRRKGNIGLLILLALIFALNGLLALLHNVGPGNDSVAMPHATSQAMMIDRSAEDISK